MPLVPIAAFLTGALLSLLLPVALLIALSIWYWAFSARVPAADDAEPGGPPPAPEPAAALPPDITPPAPEA